MFMSYLFFLEQLCGTENSLLCNNNFLFSNLLSPFVPVKRRFHCLFVLMCTLPSSAKLCCIMSFFS